MWSDDERSKVALYILHVYNGFPLMVTTKMYCVYVVVRQNKLELQAVMTGSKPPRRESPLVQVAPDDTRSQRKEKPQCRRGKSQEISLSASSKVCSEIQ